MRRPVIAVGAGTALLVVFVVAVTGAGRLTYDLYKNRPANPDEAHRRCERTSRLMSAPVTGWIVPPPAVTPPMTRATIRVGLAFFAPVVGIGRARSFYGSSCEQQMSDRSQVRPRPGKDATDL